MIRIACCISFAVLANIAMAHALQMHGATFEPRPELTSYRRKPVFPPEPSLN